ncbi:hypothetical protein V8E55_008548 [Tylopilus felleus]
MPEHAPLTEIHSCGDTRAVTFAANSEYLLSGDEGHIRVRRVKDGQQVEALEAGPLWSLVASRDGQWIAAGTHHGEAIVWNARTCQKVFAHRDTRGIRGVDFSADSTRLIALGTSKVVVWDLTSHKQVQTIRHQARDRGVAAKVSLQGDRIAIATDKSVRVLDSADYLLLAEIEAGVTPDCNTGLVWANDHLFIVSGNTIKRFDTSTGSLVSEWPVPDSNGSSCVALPKHAKFIAYSTNCSVTLWDTTSTHSQLASFPRSHDIRSIAISPDDRFLAICQKGGIITIECLSRAVDSFLSHLHPTFKEPDIHIDDDALFLWEHDRLKDAEASLTAAITTSQNSSHHELAARALVRARLKQWKVALIDAEMAIKHQPCVIGYIAKSVAHVGKGEKDEAYRTCDIASERYHSAHVSFLLLFKAIIVFMAGAHLDAISRVDDLIAMISGWKFDDLHITIRQCLCDALYRAGRTLDAVERFRKMTSELGEETSWHDEHRKWASGFRKRCSTKLERLGDAAVDTQKYNEAISHYTTALSLNPPSPQGIHIKRGKAYMETDSWKQALYDADQVITLDESSPSGYEIKHAALHKEGDYANAVVVFATMLSKIEQSPDPYIRQRRDKYKTPSKIRTRIRRIVHRTLRDLPRVLIHTTTGRLHDRVKQAAAFESLPIFNELVSSMTTCIDRSRIKNEVRQYFRYVMLSHKWEQNEPLIQQVIHITVYDLEQSPTHLKLQTFCGIVRDAGFHWAWSDTCCINKSDNVELQEALVAMFKWYRGSALVIVFLRGVRSSSQRGALVNSIWNKRAWTLQEYIAAKVVHFYTEDWTPYLDLQLPNHKESPEVILEMEHATRISAQELMALRPGLTNIREKLCLASTRQATEVEDAAYSLFGIFKVAGLPTIYGEGNDSLGRLLSHVLAGSGDVSVLAWTGESGSFNSCLPSRIAVFISPATSHIPPPIPAAEMERIIKRLYAPSFDLDVALRLYDRLSELPTVWFTATRMRLPCIAFQLPALSRFRTSTGGRLYRADTATFGTVDIRTRQDLFGMESLYLVHPWLDTLLARERTRSGGSMQDDVTPPSSPDSDDEEIPIGKFDDHPLFVCEPETRSFIAGSHTAAPMNKEMQARWLVARLRQPFGALLVAAAGQRSVDYMRVAADSSIMVQIRDNVPLTDILGNVCTLDIL